MTLSLTAIGAVPHGQALRRSGARAGDLVFVSGTIGDAALGLAALRGELDADDARRTYLVHRYRRPQPRLALGKALRGVASACIDVSDGLLADLGHILETSAVGADIDLFAVPLSADRPGDLKTAQRLRAVAGGDDYELLFTAPPEREMAVAEAASKAGVPVTRIGRIAAGADLVLRDDSGDVVPVSQRGYQHF